MNKKIAFTLIELLVVIAIIGILSGLIVVSMGGMTTKATIAKAQVFSNSLRNSLMMNIVGEWKFDELTTATTGTVLQDTWGGNNNLTLSTGTSDSNNKISTSNCISGNCLIFDGSDDYAYVSGSDSTFSPLAITGAITLSAWAKPSVLTNVYYQAIIHKIGAYTDQGGYSLSLSLNKWTAVISSGSGTRASLVWSNTPVIDSWYNLVFVYDGAGNMKLYVNGESISGTTAVTLSQGTQSFRIGKSLYYNGFSGSIDDVRVYNAAIPTSQIREQYFTGLNSLLVNGSISIKEYAQRMEVMNLAIK
jgi:prepilin-type N-terminal cleavage/methylation domain-containing protein